MFEVICSIEFCVMFFPWRSWQYDRWVVHDGRTLKYLLVGEGWEEV